MTDLTALRCIGSLRYAKQLFEKSQQDADEDWYKGMLVGMTLYSGRLADNAGIAATIAELIEVSGEPGL